MKRIFAFLCSAALLCCIPVFAAPEGNLLPAAVSQMNPSNQAWFPFGGTVEYRQEEQNTFLAYKTQPGQSWCSPALDLFGWVKKGGAGEYQIQFDIMVSTSLEKTALNALFRCSNKTTHCTTPNDDATEFRGGLGRMDEMVHDVWRHITVSFDVAKEDLTGTQTWLFCFDSIPDDISYIYLDNVELEKKSDTVPTAKAGQSANPVAAISGEKITANNGNNLIEKASADFDNIQDLKESRWVSFQGSPVLVEKGGYVGNCIAMYDVPYSWSSPALNIYPYIKEPGQYTISMLVKVVFEGEAANISITLRGDSANSFIQDHTTQFFSGIGGAEVTSGQWAVATGTFLVAPEDLQDAHNWMVCLGNLPANSASVRIDSVELIKNTAMNPPPGSGQTGGQNNQGALNNGQNNANSQGGQNEQSSGSGSKVLFNPLTWAVAIGAAGVTLSIVILTIAVKIKWAKREKNQSSASNS